ncbi:phytoene/squalene synthase family protein [Mesorhizobium sp. M7A.F.Ca.CA.001.07.2.1]|nr:phytoene/squalene synthase family protein [Mesorhizobium sp. M7A.T.Ca.TU.009.01.3.1]RUU87767.1 phytoene/squalene synthase family protein [Mesorhizobium sp. M7A.F.Ca.MR.176.00.0.0]RUX75468.1 phytoene/squalene synthase family protein [Mesorhizobium sp. M7A.F.Ca.CA.004.08.2.1]RUX80653.1 phytoene/squalene synthase family protein [Mesorhizobium sp. M7A.F.Ca.CA.004.08.1.1]RUY20747.1 phytoene/squalene synthase family protein [Mesorhizobium sp. M7A.F.Ca.CA.004.12.1.1]RUY50649.1 phytoene/squalene sy
MDAVRAADHDRYLTALYAPDDKRDALFSLYAFNAEIAGIRDRIHEALPGEVRLQWWRDVIAAGGEAGAGHPTAEALNATIATFGLPKPAFENMLDARIFDLYDDPMPSRTDLEGYCGETAAALIQLAAMVLDPVGAPRFADLAGRAGCAQAMTGLLLLLPLHRRRGQCFVPADILAAAGSSPEEFIAGDGGPGAKRAVAAMMALAREHLSAFEQGAPTLPVSLRPAFLPLALSRAYLGKMENGSPLEGVARLSALRRHWLLLRRASKGWPAL